jgi:hypothetical protein
MVKIPIQPSDILFAIFTFVFGVASFVSFPFSGYIAGALAIVVGILKFMSK